MSTNIERGGSVESRNTVPVKPYLTRLTFDWIMVVCGFILVFGAHLDAWAHTNIPQLETFFTPWHAVLYSGYALNALVLLTVVIRSKVGIRQLRKSVPEGYFISLIGCAVFFVGGILDMCWHLIFGIEHDFAALLSPTHLVLMVGAGMIVTGPLRSAMESNKRKITLPAILSATLLLSMLTFFGQFDHPYTSQWVASPPGVFGTLDFDEELGVLGILYQAATFVGVALVVIRRFAVPFGTFTVMLGFNAMFITMIHQLDPIMIVVVALGGLCVDILNVLIKPSWCSDTRFRVFGGLANLPLFTLYMAAIGINNRLWWEVHVYIGVVLASGLTGWLLSILLSQKPLLSTEE